MSSQHQSKYSCVCRCFHNNQLEAMYCTCKEEKNKMKRRTRIHRSSSSWRKVPVIRVLFWGNRHWLKADGTGRIGRLDEAHYIGNHARTTCSEKDQRRFGRSSWVVVSVVGAIGSGHAVTADPEKGKREKEKRKRRRKIPQDMGGYFYTQKIQTRQNQRLSAIPHFASYSVIFFTSFSFCEKPTLTF